MPTNRAIIYCRVSSSNQDRGVSVIVQEQFCREWCEVNRINIHQTLKEIKSAYKVGKNKQKFTLNEAKKNDRQKWLIASIEYLKSIGGGLIVCYHPDRFSRNLYKARNYIELMKRHNIEIVFPCVNNGQTLRSNNDVDLEKIYELVEIANNESNAISRRVTQANQFLKRNALPDRPFHNGTAPLGYKRERVELPTHHYYTIVENKEEQILLKELCMLIFTLTKNISLDEAIEIAIEEMKNKFIRGKPSSLKKYYLNYVSQISCCLCINDESQNNPILLCEYCMSGIHRYCLRGPEPEDYVCEECMIKRMQAINIE
jgi:DNA invertase Pin-like site-specific DNA recombinase